MIWPIPDFHTAWQARARCKCEHDKPSPSTGLIADRADADALAVPPSATPLSLKVRDREGAAGRNQGCDMRPIKVRAGAGYLKTWKRGTPANASTLSSAFGVGEDRLICVNYRHTGWPKKGRALKDVEPNRLSSFRATATSSRTIMWWRMAPCGLAGRSLLSSVWDTGAGQPRSQVSLVERSCLPGRLCA